MSQHTPTFGKGQMEQAKKMEARGRGWGGGGREGKKGGQESGGKGGGVHTDDEES